MQPAGAGDILFEQSIAQDFVDEGFKVIWPVETVYASLSKHFPNIAMVDKSLISIDYESMEDHEVNGARIIPMRFTDRIMKLPYVDCMKSKYMYLEKDWTKWKENCKIVRDAEAEKRLYYEVLKLKDGENYNFISEQFMTGGKLVNQIKVENGMKNVYMTFVPGYTLIDWLMVMERATTIHAISSSWLYLFELYQMKAHQHDQIHLYVRRPVEHNHDNYKYLLSKTGYVLMPMELRILNKRIRT